MQLNVELNKKEQREEIVQDLMRKYTFICMYNGDLYVYENGVYSMDEAEIIIEQTVEKELGEEATRHDENEVINSIKCRNYVDWNFFDMPLNEICVNNGVFDIEQGTIDDHDPIFHFQAKLPVTYVPKITECPKIDKFFHEITGSQEAVDSLYEFFGYCLYRKYTFHKAFMLIGEGDNGKSTLLKLLKAFLGKENVSNVALQDLCQTRFTLVTLYGKLANIYADLEPKRGLYQTGRFKMLVGGDPIDAERKFLQRRLKFENCAKLIFSCNKIPINENDDTDAFWRRWIIINFPNQFKGDDCDPNILNKMTVPEELSGLLYKSIKALQRLLKKGHFTKDPSSEEIRENWIMASDSIKAFREKCLDKDPKAVVVKAEVYRKFIEFCEEHNLPTIDNNIFSRKLRKHIDFYDCQKTVGGRKGVYCYAGIKLIGVTSKGQTQFGD